MIITIITARGISNLVADDVVGYKNKKLIIIIKIIINLQMPPSFLVFQLPQQH